MRFFIKVIVLACVTITIGMLCDKIFNFSSNEIMIFGIAFGLPIGFFGSILMDKLYL